MAQTVKSLPTMRETHVRSDPNTMRLDINHKKKNYKKHKHMEVHSSGDSDGKASVYNAGNLGSIPGSGRSPGEGNGNPLQHYCLENPMDTGAW